MKPNLEKIKEVHALEIKYSPEAPIPVLLKYVEELERDIEVYEAALVMMAEAHRSPGVYLEMARAKLKKEKPE